MEFVLPESILAILRTLHDAGFQAQVVGGAVRDLILDKPTSDWDVTTNATPEQILSLFTESFYENTFGTVMVSYKHLAEQFTLHDNFDEHLIFDITTYRSDGEYRNHRKPETVVWGSSIEEDLARRDFAMNAIALHIDGDTQTFIDPYDGQGDISAKRIKTVGVARERFEEDALRMLRAIRFAVQLGFTIEDETYQAIITCAPLLAHISEERISDEFLKMLASNQPKRAIELLDETGLLVSVLPELLPMKGVRQSGHHIYDVWEHSIRALDACESADPLIRLTALLHDVGKPVTAQEKADGTMTFYGHEVVGARMAKAVGRRLRLSKEDCNMLFTLVRWHMFVYDNQVTDAYIRRFIRRVGLDNIMNMITVRRADRVGSGSKADSWRLDELQDRIEAELHQPLQIKDLAIDGHDVMELLGIKPGPAIGKFLQALFEEVLDHPEFNTKECLTAKLHELADSHIDEK